MLGKSQTWHRALAAVERWMALETTGTYPAFVAHADVVKLLLASYMGLDVKRAGGILIDNASVSMVELEDDRPPRVVAMSWSPRPGWLKPPESLAAPSPTQDTLPEPEK